MHQKQQAVSKWLQWPPLSKRSLWVFPKLTYKNKKKSHGYVKYSVRCVRLPLIAIVKQGHKACHDKMFVGVCVVPNTLPRLSTAHLDSLHFTAQLQLPFEPRSADGLSLVWPRGAMPVVVFCCRWGKEREEVFVSAVVKLQASSHSHKHAQTNPNM